MMKRLLFVWLAAAPLAFSGSAFAGDEMKGDMKGHTMMEGAVALGGYCPVAYAAMGKAVKGDLMYASQHMGRTFHFANADAKKVFDANPSKYVVSYDGFCATAVAMGKKVASDPALFSAYEGKVYLFSNTEAKAAFDKDPAGTVAKADSHWPHLAKPMM